VSSAPSTICAYAAAAATTARWRRPLSTGVAAGARAPGRQVASVATSARTLSERPVDQRDLVAKEHHAQPAEHALGDDGGDGDEAEDPQRPAASPQRGASASVRSPPSPSRRWLCS